MGKMYPGLHSSSVVKRFEGGRPILSSKDIPYEADCIFNAGVAKYRGRYVMLFRNDYQFDGKGAFGRTVIGLAFSDDGIKWKVEDKPFLTLEDMGDEEITRVYDPRLTVIEDKCYICFAVDTRHGLRGGIGVTEDFKHMELLSMTVPDNRNMVLFPEKIDGKFVRLERPFPVYSRGGIDRFDIWMSRSYDMKYWGESELLMGVEDVPFANDKIGPGAPPIRTDAGWLTLFHTVDIDHSRGKNGWEERWQKRYCAGVMLLDLEDPSRIIGMSKEPLIAPETAYETDEGFRTNVIFPGGLILEDDKTVKIYYGASDTVECLATARVEDLIELCH
ncbi:glycoside hydrolase family 130 protein [Butyrivibrio sp. MC2013]|uniref:glycoside hydrolase family 130 protein n=1 Tax=Butyrivibrio sp. MC2013 TaxID=1280686 RepID=UPI00047ED9C9|nr:glycoside hydrolase family 130 protein [Butyrivibrio sp. MC2013]